MSENQVNPGGAEGRTEDQNSTAPTTPPFASAHSDPSSGWGRPGEPRTQPVPVVGHVSAAPQSTPPGGHHSDATPTAAGTSPGQPTPYHGWSIPGPHTMAQTGGPQGTGSVRRGVVAGVAALAIALTAGGVGGFVGYALHPDGSPLQIPASTSNGNAAPVIDRSSLASIAAALQPAIVDITSSSGEGSGVVISQDGNIVTNNHVIAGNRGDTVRVTFNSGKQVQARIVGADPQTDLAVIKVDATGLSFANWGDSNAVQVGDTVLAIGSPLGLQGSVTAGIVSALHRTITVGADQRTQFDTGNAVTIGDAIQTDAPINPGNSGGALVDMKGEVIGINSAIATQGSTGNIGVGFAISANKAKSVTDRLVAGQQVDHPFVGVRITDSDSGGARIESVEAGSPAAKAGLQAGDVVTKVGDRPIRGSEDLIGAIQGSTVGSNLQLTIQRGGSEQTVTVTVGQQ